MGFPGISYIACNVQDPGLIPGLGRSPGERNNGTHSSTLAWRIPWTEEPDKLQSMGLQRVIYDWAIHTHKYSYNHWIILNSSYLNICIHFFTLYLNIPTTLSFSLCIPRLHECFFILLLTFWGRNFLATVQKGVEFFCFSVAQTVQYCLTNASKIWRCSWLLIAWYKCPGEMEGHWPYRCPFSSKLMLWTLLARWIVLAFKIWWIRAIFISTISIKYDTHWVVSTLTLINWMVG